MIGCDVVRSHRTGLALRRLRCARPDRPEQPLRHGGESLSLVYVYPDGETVTSQYDVNGIQRPTSSSVTLGSSTLWSQGITYDNVGNVLQLNTYAPYHKWRQQNG